MTTAEFSKDSNVLAEEECESCRIPEQVAVSQNPEERDNETEECELCRIPEPDPKEK